MPPSASPAYATGLTCHACAFVCRSYVPPCVSASERTFVRMRMRAYVTFVCVFVCACANVCNIHKSCHSREK